MSRMQNSEYINIVHTSSQVSTGQLVQKDLSATTEKKAAFWKDYDNYAANICS